MARRKFLARIVNAVSAVVDSFFYSTSSYGAVSDEGDETSVFSWAAITVDVFGLQRIFES